MSRDRRVPWRNETAYRKVPDQVAALVLERQRWHRDHGVVGEQGDDRRDVAALERVGEPGRDPLLARRAWQRSLVTPARWQVVGDRGPGALEQVVRCVDGAAECVRRLSGAEPEHVAEHQGGALPGREVLQGG